MSTNDAIRAVKPDIIYASISGFGEEGPFAHQPVYDPIVQALSGLCTIQAGSDEARPRLVRTIVPDKLTGMTMAQAISSALVSRERTGEGQHVRVSMLDAVISFLWSSDMGSQTFVGKEVSAERAATFIDLIYETANRLYQCFRHDQSSNGKCSPMRLAIPNGRGPNASRPRRCATHTRTNVCK
ncbi:MAG: CoA transferase [Gammaproteobacteria bacterium]|nr:CoA transferase [Gammaproteobacteria bacterium]